jgi:hypothetical protein
MGNCAASRPSCDAELAKESCDGGKFCAIRSIPCVRNATIPVYCGDDWLYRPCCIRAAFSEKRVQQRLIS